MDSGDPCSDLLGQRPHQDSRATEASSSNYDVIIVGASIAGSASAIALAREGYRILLLDQAVFPRHKCCGEGIMPQGVACLEELGLLSRILSHGGVQFRGICLRSPDGVWAQADFPATQNGRDFGVAMRRFDLDHLILERVKTLPNVTVREGFRVSVVLREGQAIRGVLGHSIDLPEREESFRSPLTIAADGPNSIFHADCALTKTYLSRQRFGVAGHLRGLRQVRPYVEIIVHAKGEIYVAPCGQGVSLVALLLDKRVMKSFRGGAAERYMSFLRAVPTFGNRMADCEFIPPVLVAGPLGFTVEPLCRPGLLLVGDSAGFLDPITGEGMTLALKSVQAAVPVINEAFATGNFGAELLQQYADERTRLVKDIFQITRLLLAVSKHKVLANRAIRRLNHDKALFSKLLGIVTGTNRYAEFSVKEKCSLLLG